MSTRVFYLISSLFFVALFVYEGMTGGRYFDTSGLRANRPTGPGQHFHK